MQAQTPSAAIPHLRKAISRRSNFVEPIINLARAYKIMGRANQVHNFFERAIKMQPGHPMALLEYGEVLTNLGKMEQAIKVFKKRIALNVSVPEFLHKLTVIHKFGDDDEELDLIDEMLAEADLKEYFRISLHHSGGKILSDLKRFDESFGHYSKAKDIAGASFDIISHWKTYDRMISLFTPEFVAERPVFIVGMPRSGTPLTEQICASHPEIYGAGEITDLPSLVKTPGRWQVRQPIYKSSVKSWKKYEAHLGPLIEALGDVGEA